MVSPRKPDKRSRSQPQPQHATHESDDDAAARRAEEEALDEALKETFPASDPIAVRKRKRRDP